MKRSDLQRFHAHTRREGECLIWTSKAVGTKSKAGAFSVKIDGVNRTFRAHRWIYEQLVGPIPEGYDIDHVKSRGCSGSMCVEISHLEAVTHDENMRRARLDLCRSGRHDLTVAENVRWDERGRRRGCLICPREKALARYHANREELAAQSLAWYHANRESVLEKKRLKSAAQRKR